MTTATSPLSFTQQARKVIADQFDPKTRGKTNRVTGSTIRQALRDHELLPGANMYGILRDLEDKGYIEAVGHEDPNETNRRGRPSKVYRRLRKFSGD